MGDTDIAAAVEAACGADTAIVFVGRSGEWDTGGSDLQNIALPPRQGELVAAGCAANSRTVVVLHTGGPVELPWLGNCPALFQAWSRSRIFERHAILDLHRKSGEVFLS